jgi:hypothetical protein
MHFHSDKADSLFQCAAIAVMFLAILAALQAAIA